MLPCGDWSDVLLTIPLETWVLGRRTTETKDHFDQSISRLPAVILPAAVGLRGLTETGLSGPPAGKAKAEALAAKKAALKGAISCTEKKVRTAPTFGRLKTGSLNTLGRATPTPGRSKLAHCAIIQFPLTTESAMKKTEDVHTLGFTMDVQANKRRVNQTVKKLYDSDVAKVKTLIRPDGEKKAYLWLAPHYDALDVANKIGII
uniref:60S ribosomal protein L23a-like n=1 Tax=Jaculus jaculus TaxID=51337 RepID=UPI001E1B4C15|nr:60S ribosomal protein L23a-like [Jaculus jaculus]